MVPGAHRALPEAPRQCILSSNMNQEAEAEAGEEKERERERETEGGRDSIQANSRSPALAERTGIIWGGPLR